MATTQVINETPATATAWFVVWRLFQTLLLAGWTVAYSSDGATFSAADNWTPAGFSGLGSSSYVILTGPGGRQVAFLRTSTSTTTGYVYYVRDGGWGTAGATATTLPTAPTGTVTIRSNTNWFGSTAAPVKLFIRAEDVATSDGDFWVAYSTSTAWTSGGGAALGFCALEDTEVEDTDPYAWWAPPPSTSSWSTLFNNAQLLLAPDTSFGGSWWRWWKSGEADQAWKSYSGQAHYAATSSTGTQGNTPSFANAGSELQPHTAEPVVHYVRLVKGGEATFKDPNGGRVKNLFFANPTDIPNLRTLGAGAYAKLGNWLVVRWDGNPLNPPAES